MDFSEFPVPGQTLDKDILLEAVKVSKSIRDLNLRLGIPENNYSVRWHIEKYSIDISHFTWKPYKSFEEYAISVIAKNKKHYQEVKDMRKDFKFQGRFKNIWKRLLGRKIRLN